MSSLFTIEAIDLSSCALPQGVQAYRMYGSLFFGAVGKVEQLADQLPEDTRVVVLALDRLVSLDTSGLDALVQLRRTLERKDRTLVLCEINEQPMSLIRRSRQDELFGLSNLQLTLDGALGQARRLATL
jgi:SulP family sulfate permease